VPRGPEPLRRLELLSLLLFERRFAMKEIIETLILWIELALSLLKVLEIIFK